MPVDRATIRTELERIGEVIQAPTRFILFGGCCMSARGIKDTTKDVDAVVDHDRAIHTLIEELGRVGYQPAEEIPLTDSFDMWIYCERENVMSMDLFPPGRIFGCLQFSQRMAEATDEWFTEGNLTVELAPANAVFLLKSVTGRWRDTPDRDIEDLQTLLDQGLISWERVQEEWDAQLADGVPNEQEARELASEAMEILEQKGYTVGFDP
ncbi:hypothetical protein BRD56_08730 [Thermoplasmatales archaeon SW_10_69_26]|nr:MAG: hypothetical protein BRD56_08730 [Thermoplasmatales archaeon SW_10_69_26]